VIQAMASICKLNRTDYTGKNWMEANNFEMIWIFARAHRKTASDTLHFILEA